MNQTTSAYADAWDELDDDVDDTDADEIFEERLQTNPEICSNCWTKLRDVWFPHEFALDKRGQHTVTWTALVRYYIAKADRTTAALDTDVASNPTKACRGCGAIGGTTSRPLTLERAVEYAWNLSRTLYELKIEHNPLVLAFVVAHRKRFPAFGSTDDDTFRLAIEYALPETSYDVGDVLEIGRDDPARIVRENGGLVTSPVVERPALPAPDDDARSRAFHGRPALFERDETDETDDVDEHADEG